MPISEPSEDLADISAQELKFWEFLSQYYLCSIGEVYKAAYPIHRIQSEQNASQARTNAIERSIATHKKMTDALVARAARLRARLVAKEEAIAVRLDMEATKGPRIKQEPRIKLQAEADAIREELQAATLALENIQNTPAVLPQPQEQPAPPVPMPLCATATELATKLTKKTPLLWEASPRTEIFAQLAQKTLCEGKDVLILEPEHYLLERTCKELTHLPINYLRYSSTQTPASRRKVSDELRRCHNIVVGTRSALLLPYSSLGLIIVDREEDISYKQGEPAPRYNARDAAIALSLIHACPVILGSDNPSLETRLNCAIGKYTAAPNTCKTALPAIELIDTIQEQRKNGMIGHFSRKLIAAISSTEGKCTLIRGWEKEDDVREQAAALFPGRDLCISNLSSIKENGAEDSVLTAVLCADAFLPKDDFRADEKLLKTLRTIRTLCGGLLMIQTRNSEHPVYTSITDGSALEDRMLTERRDFGYPPFTRLIDIVFTDSNDSRKSLMIKRMVAELRGFKQVGATPDRLRYTLPKDAHLQSGKTALANRIEEFEKKFKYTGHIHIDVDPA